MSIGIGAKSKLAYIEETTYGTFPSAVAGVNLGFVSEGITSARNSLASQEINPQRKLTSIRSGNVSAGGPISVELSPNALGTFFKHLLMSAVTTTTVTPTVLSNSLAVTRGTFYSNNSRIYLCTRSGNAAADAATVGLQSVDSSSQEINGTAMFQYYGAAATTLYKHVMAGGVTKPAGGLAIEREAFLDTGSQFFRYNGGRINSGSISIPQEGAVTCSFDMLFLNLVSQGASSNFSTTTTPTDEPFIGVQTVIRSKPVGGSYSEDFDLTSASINIGNSLDGNLYTIGSNSRRSIQEQNRTVGGNISAVFENMTKFNYYANENIVALEFSFHHLGQFMKIELPTVKLTGGSPAPTISGNGTLTQSFDFTAFSNTAASEINIEFYNSTSSY